MKSVGVGHVIFWSIGTLMLSISVYFTVQYEKFRDQGKEVNGIVIRQFQVSKKRTAPIVSYTVDGKEYIYEHATATSTNTETYPVGSLATLLYLPEAPSQALLKETAYNRLFGYVMIPVACLFILVPSVMLWIRMEKVVK